VDLRQLRYFVAIAERGSLNAAASAINVAQSALSKHMKLLEAELGGAIFERGARGVELSESGRLLLDRARYILNQMDNLRAEVSLENRETSGTVRIGAPSSLADILYEPLARHVADRFPRVRLQFATGLTEDIKRRLLHGALDLAIVTEPQPNPHLRYELLFKEQNYLVGPPDDPVFKAKFIDQATLRSFKMVLPLSVDERERIPGSAQSSILCDSVMPMKRMAASGLGYALLPYSGIADELAARRLGATMVRRSATGRTMALPLGRPIARATRELILVLKEECALLVEAGKIQLPKSRRQTSRTIKGRNR